MKLLIDIAKINFYSFLFFLISISFNDRLMIYSFDFWLLTYVADFIINRRWNRIKITKNKILFIPFILVFLGSIATITYSKDVTSGWHIIERQLPIVFIMLIGSLGLNEYYTLEISLKTLTIGVILSILCILFIIFFQVILTGYHRGDFLFNRTAYVQDVIGTFRHRSYLGLIGLYALISVYFLFKENLLNKLEKAYFPLGSVGIIAIIFLSEARIIIVSFCILIFLIMLVEGSVLIKNKVVYFSALLIIIILFFALGHQLPRYQHLIHSDYLKSEKLATIEPRVYIWSDSWNLIKSNWLFGYGLGDVQDELDTHYKRRGFVNGYNHHYNAHNQFLQSALEGGIPSVIILLSTFAGLILISVINKKMLGVLLTIVLLMSFLVESLLHRILGVILFSIVPLIISMQNQSTYSFGRSDRTRLKLIGVKSLLILTVFSTVLVIIIIINKTKFDPTDPATYASQPYEILPIDASVNFSSEMNIKGFRIDESYFLENNDGQGHSYMVIYSEMINSGDSLYASIQCKISETFRNGRVGFAIGGPSIGYKTTYPDMDVREEWQELNAAGVFTKGNVRIILIFSALNTDSVMQGSVVFAFPTIRLRPDFDRSE